MNDIEFRTKLKEALETLDQRVRMLEHTLNDVVIGSLESAANEYQDNEKYETFKSNYGSEIEPMISSYKVLFGDDYDLERELYNDLKSTEGYGSDGFDEAGVMSARISDLKDRLTKLQNKENEVKAEIQEAIEEENSGEVDLKAELAEAMREGI